MENQSQVSMGSVKDSARYIKQIEEGIDPVQEPEKKIETQVSVRNIEQVAVGVTEPPIVDLKTAIENAKVEMVDKQVGNTNPNTPKNQDMQSVKSRVSEHSPPISNSRGFSIEPDDQLVKNIFEFASRSITSTILHKMNQQGSSKMQRMLGYMDPDLCLDDKELE